MIDPVEDYRFNEKRKNNPPAGMGPFEKAEPLRRKYEYDPHLDPQLTWSGKKERTSFEVETVSLHVHERISTKAILTAVRRMSVQRRLFEDPQLPLDEAVEFYQHDVNWSNRLILGDSLLVMNSLLEKELIAGKVQMIYMDPPYGVNYRSNFQPRIDRRDVKERDEDLTREPEQIKAYRDTWQLGVHSYLAYLRDRLLLCRDVLGPQGSIFVQISDENVHHVRNLMDEIFGKENFLSQIAFVKTTGTTTKLLASVFDYLLWYAKDKEVVKYRQLYLEKSVEGEGASAYNKVMSKDGTIRNLTEAERNTSSLLPKGARLLTLSDLTSQSPGSRYDVVVGGKTYRPEPRYWSRDQAGMEKLIALGRVYPMKGSLRFIRFLDDFAGYPITDLWDDTGISGAQDKLFVVQTNTKVVARCLQMATDPGDLVLDPTCGSGTTAYVAEMWGRRWITCDTSRVAIAVARERLMTATYPYFKLLHPESGVKGGFVYQVLSRVRPAGIAKGEPPVEEQLYDRPEPESGKVRVSGPYSLEAIPVAAVGEGTEASAVTEAPASYVSSMIDMLQKEGIVLPGGTKLKFEAIRGIPSESYLHAEGVIRSNGDKPQRVAVSFGPRYGPVTARQVEDAVRAAAVDYDLLVFAGFAFDPEAQAFVQKSPPRKLRLLMCHIKPDVLVGDLLKTTGSGQLFTVFGQPDVTVSETGSHYTVTLGGVDVYDPVSGEARHSSGDHVAAWFLDQDYDGYTFLTCQAFFPSAPDGRNPWKSLEKALHGKIDETKLATLSGTKSLPFEAGEHNRIAVKVIDFYGNEVIRITSLGAKAEKKARPSR